MSHKFRNYIFFTLFLILLRPSPSKSDPIHQDLHGLNLNPILSSPFDDEELAISVGTQTDSINKPEKIIAPNQSGNDIPHLIRIYIDPFSTEINKYFQNDHNQNESSVITWQLSTSSNKSDNKHIIWEELPYANCLEDNDSDITCVGSPNWRSNPDSIISSTNSQTQSIKWSSISQKEVAKELSTLNTAEAALSGVKPDMSLFSLNRSVFFGNHDVGPDIAFLVPQGFKWNRFITLDSSIRGWSKRQKDESFIGWNNGDAVGQIFYQPMHRKNWSFGASLGIRSITNNPNTRSKSAVGEGLSAGFRLDYALSDTSGIAIGAEQLIHFDETTDTGRDIYLVGSKGWWLGGGKGIFPLGIATAGIGTGYLGRNPNLQFGCSNFVDAGIAQIDNPTFYPLCWNPIGSMSLVINPQLSLFSEYNGFSFILGSSVRPFKQVPLRATWGVTLAQDFGGGVDDYRFELDRARWFFRVSLGFF